MSQENKSEQEIKEEKKKAVRAKTAAVVEKAKKQAEEAKEKSAQETVVEHNDDDDEIIHLTNDKGETIKFYHIATIDYQNEWFVFFQPAEKMQDISEEEVVVFKLDSDDEGNDIFSPVESEELLQSVYAEYVKLMEEEGCDCEDGCKECNCDHKEEK